MAISPPHAVVVTIDGRRLPSYRRAYLRDGHILAPVDPFVTRLATTIAVDGRHLVIYRGDRFAELMLAHASSPRQFAFTDVPVARVLRALDIAYRFDGAAKRLDVRPPRTLLALPTPFNPAVPRASPTELFTPIPSPTPRPVVTGRPSPRRTPVNWEPTPLPH